VEKLTILRRRASSRVNLRNPSLSKPPAEHDQSIKNELKQRHDDDMMTHENEENERKSGKRSFFEVNGFSK
jgi:hypothetical protein